jgi:hypothetical protein
MALPTLPIELPTLGAVFPPTWVVIDNGHPSDKAVSEKIVDYLMTKFPPVLAVRREVPAGEEPDPADLMAHGVIAVGGVGAQPWLRKYNEKMDPRVEENDGTVDFVEPIARPIHIVKKEPAYDHACVEDTTLGQFLISSCTGAFPWLTVFQVNGYFAEDTVKAGDKFCEGETKGIWVGGVKVSDTE